MRILPGDIICVQDNGRGVPVGVQHQTGLPAVTVVYTILHAGGKFGGGSYKVSGGLHGVGASVVNALSSWLEVEVRQGGHLYRQRFSRGNAEYDLQDLGPIENPEQTGTMVTFKADPEIFKETTVYDFATLETRPVSYTHLDVYKRQGQGHTPASAADTAHECFHAEGAAHGSA